MTSPQGLCGSVTNQDIFTGRYWYYHDILLVDFLKQSPSSPSHQKLSFMRHCCRKIQFNDLYLNDCVFIKKSNIFAGRYQVISVTATGWAIIHHFSSPPRSCSIINLKTNPGLQHSQTHSTHKVFFKFLQILLHPTRELESSDPKVSISDSALDSCGDSTAEQHFKQREEN